MNHEGCEKSKRTLQCHYDQWTETTKKNEDSLFRAGIRALYHTNAGKTRELPDLCKPNFFDKNLPSKIGVRLFHGILYPFDVWARDAEIVCCGTPSRDR
jgi:hypothetical protein